MPQYHVVRSGKRWVVKTNGRVVKRGNTKASAVSKAKALARASNGEVVVHDMHGIIQNVVDY